MKNALVRAAWRPLRGIGLMVAGCGFLAVSDATMKLLIAEIPVSQAIFLRCALLLAGLAVAQRRRMFIGMGPEAPWKLQLLCAVLWGVSMACFVASLSYLSLAVAVTALYTAPLFVALMAPRMLREELDLGNVAVVVVGFVGAVFVVSPTIADFSFYIGLPLLAALLSAWRDMTLRTLTSRASTQSIIVTTQIVITAVFLVPSIVVWKPLDVQGFMFLLVTTGSFAIGIYLTVEAFREDEASVVVPFKYSGVLWSIILGAAIWRDIPTLLQLFGVALVISTGAYLSVQRRLPISATE